MSRTKQGRDLIHKITIEQKVDTKDSIGGSALEWIEFKKAYAEVKPIRGVEFISSQAFQNSVTHRIVILYTKGILPSMRISHKNRIFNIESVRDFGEREIWLELMCKELV